MAQDVYSRHVGLLGNVSLVVATVSWLPRLDGTIGHCFVYVKGPGVGGAGGLGGLGVARGGGRREGGPGVHGCVFSQQSSIH